MRCLLGFSTNCNHLLIAQHPLNFLNTLRCVRFSPRRWIPRFAANIHTCLHPWHGPSLATLSSTKAVTTPDTALDTSGADANAFLSALSRRDVSAACVSFDKLEQYGLLYTPLNASQLREFLSMLQEDQKRMSHLDDIKIRVLKYIWLAVGAWTAADYHTFVQCAGGNLTYERAADLLDTMMRKVDCGPDTPMLVSLVEAVARSSKTEGVVRLATKLLTLRDVVMDEIVYVTMVEACLSEGEPDKALELLEIFKDDIDSMPIATSASMKIRIYGNNGDLETADRVFEDAVKSAPTPDVQIYCSYIAANRYCGTVARAEKTLEDMSAKGVMPNSDVYGEMIRVCLSHDKLAQATRYYWKALREFKIPPIEAYTKLLDAYFRTPDLSAVEKLLRDTREFQVQRDAKFYVTVVNGYMKAGRVNLAIAALEECREMGMANSKEMHTAFLHGLLRNNLLDEAEREYRKLMSELHNPLPDPAMLNVLMDAHIRRRNFSQAEKIAEWAWTMKDKGCVDPVLLNTLIRALMKKGKVNSALRVLRRLKSDPEARVLTGKRGGNSHWQPALFVAYLIIIGGLARLRLSDQAAELLNEFVREGFVPNAQIITPLLALFARKGDRKSAISLLESVVNTYGVVPDRNVLEILYEIYINLYRRDRDVDATTDAAVMRPFNFLSRDLSTLTMSQPALRSVTYAGAIANHVQCGEHDIAERLFMEMQAEGVDPDLDTLALLCQIYKHTGQEHKAQAVRFEMGDMDGLGTDVQDGVNMWLSVGTEDEGASVPEWLLGGEDSQAELIDGVIPSNSGDIAAYMDARELRQRLDAFNVREGSYTNNNKKKV